MSRMLATFFVTPLALAAVIAATPGTAAAQTAVNRDDTRPAGQTSRWEWLIPSGTVVPAAANRDSIARGHLTALQVSYRVRPNLAVTSTAGWVRSRDLSTVGSPKLDVFTYDLGVELRASEMGARRHVSFRPFAGAGVGARSYNYRSLAADATHDPGAYVAAGGEVGIRGVRVRLEVRDYVTGFTLLDGRGRTNTRNDVVVMAGLRFTR